MTIRMPTEIHEALLILGRARGWSLNTITVRALHEYLSKNATWEPVEAWLQRTADRYRAAIEHLSPDEEALPDHMAPEDVALSDLRHPPLS